VKILELPTITFPFTVVLPVIGVTVANDTVPVKVLSPVMVCVVVKSISFTVPLVTILDNVAALLKLIVAVTALVFAVGDIK